MGKEKVEIDLSKPQFDQSTYVGRAKHFLLLTNPLNILASDDELDEAKRIVNEFKTTKVIPKGHDEQSLWRMKYLYESAFHPDTGEKMFILGRMAAQAPMNTIITACMVTFYKTNSQTIFWQWFNQTFNAAVNYTNRSGSKPISKTRLITSYVAACSGALGTALYLNRKVKNMRPIFARLVPFAAVAGANLINIPMMRSNEISHGAQMYTESGEYVGDSRKAAMKGISLVCLSRIAMALPGMTVTPIVANYLTARGFFCHYPALYMPIQVAIVGLCVTFATPLGCALFDQNSSMGLEQLEPELKAAVQKKFPKETPKELYFNKGL